MPRQYVTSPVFRAVNRKISGIWAAIILVMAAGHFLDGYLDANLQGPTRVIVDLILNWAVPIGVTIVGVHFTKATIAAAHQKATQEAASGGDHDDRRTRLDDQWPTTTSGPPF